MSGDNSTAPAKAPLAVDPQPATPPDEPQAAPHWTEADYGEQFEDADSLLTDDLNSSTASLSASILEYRTLHGRTYHAQNDDDYWGPNDERQKECMDITHQVLTMLHEDKLYTAPIPKTVGKVLDVGTGTGVWAIDFADLHPEAEVVGTDITPIQPSWVPPNLKFEIEDFTLDWTFGNDTFDFVHLRYIFGAVADWKSIYEQAFRVTKPGGWIESTETSIDITSDDNTVVPGMALFEWGKLFQESGRKTGRSMAVIDGEDGLVSEAINAAGFVDVEVKTYKLPVSGWPQDPALRRVGLYNRAATEEGLEGYALYLLTAVMGWEAARVQLYLSRVRKELKSQKVHPYYVVQTIIARKPESS